MKDCDPKDIALKTFFLGPRSENSEWIRRLVNEALEQWFTWRKSFHPEDGQAISPEDRGTKEFQKNRMALEDALLTLSQRFQRELPKFSPRYIGHMFSEISLPALLGHMVTLFHNPNNVAEESSRVGMALEREAIGMLQIMVGYDPTLAAGHFTSGGTLSNIEALLRARHRLDRWISTGAWLTRRGHERMSLVEAAHLGWVRYEALRRRWEIQSSELEPFSSLATSHVMAAGRLSETFRSPYLGPVALVPENKHYSWQKGILTLGLGNEAIWPIALDRHGNLSISHLKEQLATARAKGRPVLLVVSVAGTTELGHLDPIHEVQDTLDEYLACHGLDVWHHVDGAYGGFFCAMLRESSGEATGDELSSDGKLALAGMARANSVTLDPHKLGYVPYASGTFLTRERRDYEMMPLDIPYIDAAATTPGLTALEGSRSAAGAVATWLTAKCIGLNANGYGRILGRTIAARQTLEKKLRAADPRIRIVPNADTNVCAFCIAEQGEPLSYSNSRTLALHRRFFSNQECTFVVSKTQLRRECYGDFFDALVKSWNGVADTSELALIRLVLMNPFFTSKETHTFFPDAFVQSLQSALEHFNPSGADAKHG